jgi:ribosomal 30S subunit maturation factor RimM
VNFQNQLIIIKKILSNVTNSPHTNILTKTIQPYDPVTFGYIEIGTIIGPHGVQGWMKLKCNDVDSTLIAQSQRICRPGIRHIKYPSKRAPRPITLLNGKHRNDNEYLIQCDGIIDRDVAQSYKGCVLYIRQEQQQQLLDDIATTAASTSTAELTADATSNSDLIEPEEYDVAELVGLEVFMIEERRDTNEDDNADDIGLDEHLQYDAINNDESNDGEDEDVEPVLLFVGKVNGIVFADDICSVPGLLTHDFIEIVIPRGPGGTFTLVRDELVLIPFVPTLVPIVDLDGQRIYINPPAGLLDLKYVRTEKTRIKAFLPAAAARRAAAEAIQSPPQPSSAETA